MPFDTEAFYAATNAKATTSPNTHGFPLHLKTAQDLLDWVNDNPSLKVQDRRNEAAAIKWLGRVDQTPLVAIPLDIRFLVDDRYKRIRQYPGLKLKHRSGIITLLNRVLKRAGIISVGSKRTATTTFGWAECLQQLSSDDAKSMSPLGKFCSARDIEPPQFTLGIFDQFVDETLNHSTIKKRRETVARVVRVSNRARHSTPGWPLPELPKLDNPRNFSLPKTVVPSSFWDDLNDYCTKSVTKPENLFDKKWPKQLKPDTVDRHRDQLWRAASAQIHAGRQPEEISDLAALLDLEWLEAGMNWQVDRAGDQFLPEHLNMAATWISVAKRWLRDLSLASAIREDIFDVIDDDLGPADFSEKNLRKLDQFDNPDSVNTFLLLPYTIWAEIKKKKEITPTDAIEMAVAVAIEILLCTMMRRKNLVSLDRTQHFWPQSPTTQGKWSIHLEAHEVKNDKTLNFPLRPSTISLLNFYIGKCRQLLLKQPTNRLFLGTDGIPLLGQDVYHLVKSRIQKRLGLDVHLHLFRQIGAMLFLDAHPGKLGVVKTMLGHKGDKTTERFYARLKATKAIEFFTEAVLGGRDAMIKTLKLF